MKRRKRFMAMLLAILLFVPTMAASAATDRDAACGSWCEEALALSDELYLSVEVLNVEAGKFYSVQVLPDQAGLLGWELDVIRLSNPAVARVVWEIPEGIEVVSTVPQDMAADESLSFVIEALQDGTIGINATMSYGVDFDHGHATAVTIGRAYDANASADVQDETAEPAGEEFIDKDRAIAASEPNIAYEEPIIDPDKPMIQTIIIPVEDEEGNYGEQIGFVIFGGDMKEPVIVMDPAEYYSTNAE